MLLQLVLQYVSCVLWTLHPTDCLEMYIALTEHFIVTWKKKSLTLWLLEEIKNHQKCWCAAGCCTALELQYLLWSLHSCLNALSRPALIPPTLQSVVKCVTPLLSRSAFTSNAPVKHSHPANYPQSHVGVEKHPDDVIRSKSSTWTSRVLTVSITVFPGRADYIIHTSNTQTHTRTVSHNLIQSKAIYLQWVWFWHWVCVR